MPNLAAAFPGQELVHIVGVTGETGHSGGQGQPVQLPPGEPVQALEQIVAQDQGNFPGADGGHAVCHNVRRDTQGGAGTIAPPVRRMPRRLPVGTTSSRMVSRR